MPKDAGKPSRPILEASPRFSPMTAEDKVPEGEFEITFIQPTASKSSKKPKADSTKQGPDEQPSAPLLEPGDDGGPEAKQQDGSDHDRDHHPAAPEGVTEEQVLAQSEGH